MRKERWEEGRKSVEQAARIRAQTPMDRHTDEAEPVSNTALPNQEATPASQTMNERLENSHTSNTTSPPNSPPAHVRSRTPKTYPVRSTPVPALTRPVRRSSAKSNNTTQEVKPISTQDISTSVFADKDRTVNEQELWTMLRLVKNVLQQDADETRRTDDASMNNILRLIETELSDNSALDKNAIFSSKELNDALSKEFRLEKISVEDAQYVDRLNAIRARLGTLAVDMTRQSMPMPHNKIHSASSDALDEDVPQDVALPSYHWLSFVLLAVGLVLLVGRVAQCYAEYMMVNTYYDPMYAAVFPMPSFVQTWLPGHTYYNVPFLAHTDRAIASLIAPLGVAMLG